MYLFLVTASVILAFFALLSVIRFDNSLLWKLTIIATEAGHWLAAVFVPICLSAIPYGVQGLIPVLIALAAAWTLLQPARKALDISRTLPERMTRAFGSQRTSSRPPFSIPRLFLPNVRCTKPRSLSASTPDGRNLRIDLYSPVSESPTPLLVVIHGGGWNNGDPDQLSGLNHTFRKCGYTVASISYGLVPDHQWPTQREDVIACISFLRERAHELQIDPERIVLLGRSAGGQLATQVAFSSSDPGIRGVITLYSPHDLVFAHTYAPPDDLIHSRQLLESYMGGTLTSAREKYQDASAYYHVRKNLPPALLIHGKHDLLTWYLQSFRLHRALNEHSVANLYLELSWATHAFDFFPNGPAGQLTQYSILRFLDATIGGTVTRSSS